MSSMDAEAAPYVAQDRPMGIASLARSSSITRVALACVILVACLLAASTWRVYFHTWDEPEHLAAGIELLDIGRYEYDTEHPPIARALIALGPHLAGAHSYGTPPPDGTQEGIDILYTDGHYDLYLTLARLGTLPFLALLLYAMWLWARQLTRSEGEALLAVVLLVCVPPLLGHAALATLDVPAVATTLLAFYALQQWLCSARWRDAAFFGLATGVAIGTKFSALPFIGLGFIALAATHGLMRWPRHLVTPQAAAGSLECGGRGDAAVGSSLSAAAKQRIAGLALVAVMAAIPILLAYGLRSPGATLRRFYWAIPYLIQQHGVSHYIGVVLAHVPLPAVALRFIEGMVAVKAHNDTGHLGFLLGTLRSTGWWYFYLVALAAKTPIPLLATGPAGMVLLARDGWREKNTWRIAPLVLFVAVLLFASLFSRINIGIRHVLILYPFLALGGAHALGLAWRASRTAANRAVAAAGTLLVVGLLAWQVSTLWTANPDYLPYFNEAVRHPERVLVDSDLDWGQDLRRLEKRLAELQVKQVSLAYRGTADLAREPLPPYVILPPWRPTTGWVAISALARCHDLAGYGWLNAYAPVERIGKTIDLYYIP